MTVPDLGVSDGRLVVKIPLHSESYPADNVLMEMNGVKSAIAFVFSLIALAGALVQFDKLPGVHLGAGKRKLQIGFGAKEPDGTPGTPESDRDSDRKAVREVEEEEAQKGKTAAVGSTRAEDLQLRGLFHTGRRTLAIINNETFAQGDVASVDFQGGKLLLRCEQIRTNSVVVSVSNITGTVQLFLPKDAAPVSPGRGPEEARRRGLPGE